MIVEQTPAVLAIIQDKKKFLFVKRNSKNRFEPAKWGFIGEAIKFKEDIIDALKRGIKEETNLTLKEWKLFNAYSFYFESQDKVRHAVVIAYICRCSGKVKLNFESEDYGWFSLEESEKLDLIEGNRIILSDLKKFFNNS